MKNKFLYKIAITGTLLLAIPVQAMNNNEQANKLLLAIENTINQLEIKQDVPSDIEEVDSPAIQIERGKEAKKILVSIINDTEKLDQLTQNLPSAQRQSFINKQINIVNQKQNVIKATVKNNIMGTVQQYGSAIYQLTLNNIVTLVKPAAIALVIQGLQVGTGNLLAFDRNALLTAALNQTAVMALNALSNSKEIGFLAGESATTLANNFSSEKYGFSSKNYNFSLENAAIKNPIKALITSAALSEVGKIIENAGGIGAMVNKSAFPSKTPSSPNEFVVALRPQVQTIIGNEKISSVLTQAGWVIMQSAAVGGILYLSGMGYSGSTAIESINYAVLHGIAQGTVSAIAALTNETRPGSIVNVLAAPTVQQAISLGQANPQQMMSAVVQTSAIELSNMLLDAAEQSGGILPALKKGKDMLGEAVISRWNNAWNSISGAWSLLNSSMR